MAAFRDGDRDAFEELFARHRERVIRFAFRMIGDRARSEEATQEIFIRIARAASTWQPTARFTTWMYTVARRTVLNYLRDEKEEGERVSLSPADPDEEGGAPIQLPGPDAFQPEHIVWSGQLQERFEESLRALPEGYRAAFVMAVGEGLSYQETADALGITVQAVKSRVFRAREAILSRLSGDLP